MTVILTKGRKAMTKTKTESVFTDNRPTAVARRRQGLFTVREVCDVCAIPYGSMQNHIKTGSIVAPSHMWGKSIRLYYIEDDVQKIKAYWGVQ